MGTLHDMIERAVRKRIGAAGWLTHDRERSEAEKLMERARLLDERLDAADQARRAAERDRDRALFELERLLLFVPAYIIQKTIDGTLVRVSENVARGFGLTSDDMVGRNQTEFWPAEQCAQFTRDDKLVCETGGRYGYLEPVDWQGKAHTFRTWKVPVYNGKPGPIGILLFAVDVTVVGDLSVEELGKGDVGE